MEIQPIPMTIARFWVETCELLTVRRLSLQKCPIIDLRLDLVVCWRSEESKKEKMSNKTEQLSEFYLARWLNSIFTCLCEWQEAIVLGAGVFLEAWRIIWKIEWVRHLWEEALLWKTTKKRQNWATGRWLGCIFLTLFEVFHCYRQECCSSAVHSVQQQRVHPSEPWRCPLWFSKI